MTAALILSAGLGTRLAPITAWRAKALVPIGDLPAIAHIVARLRDLSRTIVVNAHHRVDEVEAYARGAGLAVSREEELLGTCGGLAHAAGLLGPGDVLVWNGDMFGDLNAGALLEAHARNVAGGAVATLVVRARADTSGNTGLDARGDVVRIRRDECRPGEVRAVDFQGIYVVGDALRRALPPRGDIVSEAFLPAIRRGARLAAFVSDAELTDVGTAASYLEANLRWLASRGLGAWAGAGAHVAPGVTLASAVVGAGARVLGDGTLERCVVWPGAEARAPMTDAIVAPEGVVATRRSPE